jgi:DNA-binding transcriptional LysR family regulator
VAPTQTLPGYHGVIDAFLERQGLQRKVAVESPYFGLIPYMLTQTDLVLTTGRQFMRFYEKTLPLKTFTVPVKFPPMRFYQLWHQRVHQSPEHKWLRDQVTSRREGAGAEGNRGHIRRGRIPHMNRAHVYHRTLDGRQGR